MIRTLVLFEGILLVHIGLFTIGLLVSSINYKEQQQLNDATTYLKEADIVEEINSINSNDEDTYSIFYGRPSQYDRLYGVFPESSRLELKAEAKKMFEFGYNMYMKHAYPLDELNPILCTGRGPDVDNPSNININDVLGNYSLTLVDSLDTLAVMGNVKEFKRAVQLVISSVSFDTDTTVQVFEANIRLLGALLSAHLLIVDPNQMLGDLRPDGYTKELLDLAHDLATRLLVAFENSTTGLPYPRVNLRHGVPTERNCEWCSTETCTAGAGSLLLEFGLLSRLIGDPVFERVARRSAQALWLSRSKDTGLLGNAIDVETGEWVGKMSGLGAGLDSFYEYMLKSYILFGENEDYVMFSEAYSLIKRYLRRGREHCNQGTGNHPVYVNVNMIDGSTLTLWIDSLQAAFAGVQVLHGDIEEAICTHALYYAIWKRYGALPERFNWQRISTDLAFYPLRPELIESTYLLYQATKNPFYLHVGRDILRSLNNHTKARCGYATIHNVNDKSLEDRMESFFLSETCKYLYLLFDVDNSINVNANKVIFTTEGHIFPIDNRMRRNQFSDFSPVKKARQALVMGAKNVSGSNTGVFCTRIKQERRYLLPLKSDYLHQVSEALGVNLI